MKKGKILYHDRPNYFEWQFADFTSLLEVGGTMESPCFPFVGAAWCLQFDTNTEDTDLFTVAGLTRISARDPEHCISGRIGIKRDDGTEYVSHAFDEHNFKAGSKCLVFIDFVEISALSADISEIAPRDVVTFFCWLNSIHGGCREMETQTESEEFKATKRDGSEEVQCASAKGIYKLAEDVKDLFLSGKNYDTTIKVANREFQAHRLILGARSPVFASMYSHDTTERSTGIVEIEDCTPEVFLDFLFFLYSGKLESLSFKNAIGLYVVADKYDVQEVKEECLKFMRNNLCVEHFCEVMAFALEYSESELLKSATDFFVENARTISVTPNWRCFHRDYPMESNELHVKALERYAPE